MEPNTNGNGFVMPVAPIGYGGYGMPYGGGFGGMEMSGARGRDTRTGRFVSRDTMRSDMISGRVPRRMYYGESYDERDDGDLEEQLEDMINDRTLPNSKRDAARKMLAEIRKGNM